MDKQFIKNNLHQHETFNYNDNKIDILLKDIIAKLNEKGYITTFSCQSHGNEYAFGFGGDFYIAFDKIYNFETAPKYFKITNYMYMGKGDIDKNIYREVPVTLLDDGSLKYYRRYNYYSKGFPNIPKSMIHIDTDKYTQNIKTDNEYIDFLEKAFNSLENWVDKLE